MNPNIIPSNTENPGSTGDGKVESTQANEADLETSIKQIKEGRGIIKTWASDQRALIASLKVDGKDPSKAIAEMEKVKNSWREKLSPEEFDEIFNPDIEKKEPPTEFKKQKEQWAGEYAGIPLEELKKEAGILTQLPNLNEIHSEDPLMARLLALHDAIKQKERSQQE